MFKSIQARLVMLFILVILSVMMVSGTLFIGNVSRFYYDDFMNQMRNSVFDSTFIEKLSDALTAKNQVQKINELLLAYYGRIGVDSYRNFALLNGENGGFIVGSDELNIHTIEVSDNLLTALSGKVGDAKIEKNRYIDYAYPIIIENKVSYIIYVYETKDELNNFSKSMFDIIFQMLFFSLIIAVILGYLLSKTITIPIKKITSKAKQIGAGQFAIEEKSPYKDEIAILSNTFIDMGIELNKNVSEIANQKTRLEKVMEYATDGIAAFDKNGGLILINPQARKFLNIEEEQVINFDSFFSKIFDDITVGDFLYFQKDKQIIKETSYNGYYLNFHFGSFPYAKDEIGGVIVDIGDITQGKKLDLSRKEFVANVSHELRTPLTTVKAYIETLLTGDVDDETKEKFLDTINRETDRMTRLVSDLLILSKFDNDNITLNLSRMNIETILVDVAEKMQFESNKKKQHLKYELITQIPVMPIDRDKMEQVIINIVSNAIKYTQKNGVIKISSNYLCGKAVIIVRDNGMGIPKKDLNRIFERFYRVDKARSREQGGTGLGLAIAKEIVNAHAGDISIRSEVNEGTEIVISLSVDKSFSNIEHF